MGQKLGKRSAQPSLSRELSRQQVGELAALFEIIQRQFPSGRLDRANFGKVFAAGDDAFAQRMWTALDPTGSGHIDFREYALGASIFCVGSKREKIQFLFSLCDQDADGFISLMEFNQMRVTVSRFANTFLSALEDSQAQVEDEIRGEFDAADTTHDKLLSLEEFTKLFEKGEQEGSGALHDLLETIEERLRLLFVPKQLHIRCALVGPAQCGKSTLVATLTKEEVGSVYRYNKFYNLDGVPVRLEIIDSGNNRAFAYPGVDIVIVLFAVDSVDYPVLDEIEEEISSYCPKAVRIFALTKLDLQQASNEVKYKAKELLAQCSKKVCAVKSFQLAPAVDMKGSNTDMATPEELFEFAVSCVVPPFLLRPEHVHIRCGMAGPPGGGRSTMIGKLMGIDAVTSHRYEKSIDAEGIAAEIEICDSEEYNRALLLSHVHVVLLVFPVTHISFKEVEKIANELHSICPDAPVILVGSKIDLRGTTKCISAEKGEQWRQKLKAWRYAECSAAADLNVRQVFQDAVRAAVPLFSLTDSGPLNHNHAHRHLVLPDPSSEEEEKKEGTGTGTPATDPHNLQARQDEEKTAVQKPAAEVVPPAQQPTAAATQRRSGPRRMWTPPTRAAPARPLPSPPPEAGREPEPERYVAQYDYVDDQRAGVLLFKKFDVLTLLEKNSDGWWRGTLANTGQTGYFPGSYVLPIAQGTRV